MEGKENKMRAVKVLQETSRLMRHYGLGSDEFIVVLYLYFLRVAKIDFTVLNRSSGGNFGNYAIGISLPKKDFPVIHHINDIISKTFEKWPENSFYDLVQLMQELDFVSRENDPSAIFEDLIYAYDINLGKGKSIGILPQGLAQVLLEYLNLPENPKIYNPFAGYASFSQRPYSGGDYVGQEIDELTWSIGAMRLIINGYDFNPEFRKEDSISNWIDSEYFDLITAFPPFNYKILRQYPEMRYAKTAEEFVLGRSLRNLNTNGKVMCVVSNGFLNSLGADKSYRREIVDKNLLDTVISFPNGLLGNTGIPFSVLIIDKNKNSEKVRFLDLNAKISDLNKERALRNELKIQREEIAWSELFAETIKTSNSEYSLEVGRDEIFKNDYNLNVSRYFIFKGKAESLENARILSDVSEIVPGSRIGGEKYGKFVRIRNLNDGGINFTLSLEDVEASKVPKYGKEISESCILVSARWNTLKPTLFNYTGRSIYISQDIIALKPDTEIIDSGYMVNELQQEYVLEQFLKLQNGGTIPNLNKKDLLRIKIELPSLSEQRAKVQGVFAAVAQSNRKKVELQKEILGYKDEAFREFASIKHTFRQYLNALKSNVSGTRKFISRNEGKSVSLNTLYSKNLNRTLGEHLLSLEGTIDSMSRLISEETLDKGQAEILNPKELIEEAQNRFKNPEVFRFEEVFVDHSVFATEEGYLNPYIKITKDGFFRIFANIVYNAVEHGFKDRTGNIIRTSITFDKVDRFVLIEISNNGKPIPEDFTQQHLTTRGEKTTDSSGTGAGGADIKGIIQKYNANFELKKNSTSEFPVGYILKFPLHTVVDKFGLDDFNLDDLDIKL